MSKRKRREIGSYLSSAIQLAKIIPSLKKYKRRKRLTTAEKSAIARAENKIRWAHNLVPVDAEFARRRPDLLFKHTNKKGKQIGGVQAIEMANTGANIKLKAVGDDLIIQSNGRPWIYKSIPKITRTKIKKEADAVFNNDFDENFDIAAILEMARKAFSSGKVIAVHLWTERGRAGEAWLDFAQFTRWLNDRWQAYKEHQFWMRGIAILYGDAGELREYKKEVAAMRREQRAQKRKRRK